MLDDGDPAERALGIAAGLAWCEVAEATVFYTDLGMSRGMQAAYDSAKQEGRTVELRSIGFHQHCPKPC